MTQQHGNFKQYHWTTCQKKYQLSFSFCFHNRERETMQWWWSLGVARTFVAKYSWTINSILHMMYNHFFFFCKGNFLSSFQDKHDTTSGSGKDWGLSIHLQNICEVKKGFLRCISLNVFMNDGLFWCEVVGNGGCLH